MFLMSLVLWINHLFPVCWSTFGKAMPNEFVGKSDVVDSVFDIVYQFSIQVWLTLFSNLHLQ